jgi:uncharacterized membrane protein YfcA
MEAIRRQWRRSRTRVGLPLTLGVNIAGLIAFSQVTARILDGPSVTDMAAVFVASTLSSIAGFAFSAICGAMLFHMDDKPVHIVQVMIVCSIAIQIFSVMTLRNAIDWKYLGRFILGGACGLPVGVYLLTHFASAQYMKCIGLFLIAYGLYMLLRRPASVAYTNPIGDYAAGFLGGVTGGFAGFPGAFVTIWCGRKGWDKERQRGVYQPFILIMQVLALGLITFVQTTHTRGPAIDLSILSYIPGALLGTWCGLGIFRRLTDRQFAGSVNLLLIASGIGLLA